MKKICLVVVGLYIGLLSAFSQQTDSATYKKRKLKLDEINLLSSYYSQNGDNSAVTGGIGTEELKDYSINAELKFIKYDKQNRKRNWNLNVGIDYYTSASSDKINPNTLSSASARDFRMYPSLEHVVEDETKRKKTNFSLSYSVESDYVSFGIGAGITKRSKDGNKELTVKAKCYLDQVEIVLPYEMRTAETGGLNNYPNEHDYPWKSRTTLSALLSYSQVVNKSLQVMFSLDPACQLGYLSIPFHRIYFKDRQVNIERLPSSRYKLPVGIRANYFAGNKIIIRTFYRFYHDDWKLTAHTADIETVVKIGKLFSLNPFYRYYTQSSIKYFAAYNEHAVDEKFYSSNYDLSAFTSRFYGAGVRFTPLNIKGLTQLELRYGYYKRTNNLRSGVVSLFLKFR